MKKSCENCTIAGKYREYFIKKCEHLWVTDYRGVTWCQKCGKIKISNLD